MVTATLDRQIKREKHEKAVEEARRFRGSGNAHRLTEAEYDRIFRHPDESGAEAVPEDDTRVCAQCGCSTKGLCPHGHEAGFALRDEFERAALAERQREQAKPIKYGKPRKQDSRNFACLGSSVTRSQVPEMNRRFGHLGVKYRPDGIAVYADVQAKKRVLQARGMIDHNETWSGKNV